MTRINGAVQSIAGSSLEDSRAQSPFRAAREQDPVTGGAGARDTGDQERPRETAMNVNVGGIEATTPSMGQYTLRR